jgi:HEAT repeat protein
VGDAAVIPLLVKVVADRATDSNLRLEAMTTIGALATADTAELLIELLGDPLPGSRGTRCAPWRGSTPTVHRDIGRPGARIGTGRCASPKPVPWERCHRSAACRG